MTLLDLTYTRADLAELVADGRQGLEEKSSEKVQESLDLFFELLDYQPVSLGILEHDLQIFARQKTNGGKATVFEDPVFFDEESVSLGLRKGKFSPQKDLDLAWVMQYAQGEKAADLQGPEVFEFLAELAMEESKNK